MGIEKFSLAGKYALVTGGGRGIGEGIALGFADAGAAVAVTARTKEEIEKTAEKIRSRGGRAIAVACDVMKGEQVQKMTDAVWREFGRVDILVNNAGGGCPAVPFFEMDEEWWDLHVDKNLKSTFLCSKIAGSKMAEGGGGSIINISSVMGIGAHPGRAPYSAAKAGIIGLTTTLAVELAPQNIRVNAIAPGFIEVERLWKQFPNYEKTLRKTRLAKVPLGRMGVPDDVANLAIFFASDASAYITGQLIRLDGGLVTTVFYASDESRNEWL